MNEILKFILGLLSLGALAVVGFLILGFMAKEQSYRHDQQAVHKKARAIQNYCRAQASSERKKRELARRNYQAHQRALQAHRRQRLWQKRQRRLLNMTKHAVYTLWPEMANPQLRGQFIRQLIGQAIQQMITGGRLSEAWKRQVRDNLNDAQGNFQLKREISSWFVHKKQEIQSQLERQEITPEEFELHLQHLTQVYNEILQTIDMEGE